MKAGLLGLMAGLWEMLMMTRMPVAVIARILPEM